MKIYKIEQFLLTSRYKKGSQPSSILKFFHFYFIFSKELNVKRGGAHYDPFACNKILRHVHLAP